MKKYLYPIAASLVLLLALLLASCQPVEPAAPGASPAIFGNFKIQNTFMTVWSSTQSDIRLTFPNAAGTLATVGGTETLTNKTLTSPTLTGVGITGTSTIGNGMTITTPSIASPTITGTPVVSGMAMGSANFTVGTSLVVAHGMTGTPYYVFISWMANPGTTAAAAGVNSFSWTANTENITVTAAGGTNATAEFRWIAYLAGW